MSNKLVNPAKVRRVMAAIDAQIVHRTTELCTFVQLKETLLKRQTRGMLLESDLDMVRSVLRHMKGRR